MVKLFKCTLQCKIKGVTNIIEYFRCVNGDKLIAMFKQCENLEGSMYYGYTCIELIPMKLINFPEVKTLKMKCQTTKSNIGEKRRNK